MEITEIDTTAFMQIVEMAFTYAFYTVAFIGGALIIAAVVAILIGQEE